MHGSPRRGLAIGFFDGVHLGHRAILAGAAEALTFRTHPLSVLAPDRAPRLLMDAETRLAAIRATGVEHVTALDFTPEFAMLPADGFAARYLAGRGPIRCGRNWRFGAGGQGDAGYLTKMGYEVDVVPAVRVGETLVSSTCIRAALSEGRLGDAVKMLGHSWTFSGRVVPGKGEGRLLGFPTVNLEPLEEPPLARGTYAVTVSGVRALANWGVAPTFGDRAWKTPILEIHFVDGLIGSRALSALCEAGSRMEVEFRQFIRPERKFPDLASLRAAIAEDILRVTGESQI